MSLWDEATTDARTKDPIGDPDDHVNRWHMGARAIRAFVKFAEGLDGAVHVRLRDQADLFIGAMPDTSERPRNGDES